MSVIATKGKYGLAKGRELMEYRFTPEEWVKLTSAERARRCQLMADEALALTRHASQEHVRSFLQIAEAWLQLADEIEDAVR